MQQKICRVVPDVNWTLCSICREMCLPPILNFFKEASSECAIYFCILILILVLRELN